MVQLQILSKVLESGSNAIIEENFLTEDFFTGYENEYRFIQEHVQKYGNVPDKATFLASFPEIDLVDVAESDKYLVDTIREEHLYQASVPVMKKVAELLKEDSNAAIAYMNSQMAVLQPDYDIGGTDIISQANRRYEQYKERKDNPDKWRFESGFKELDEQIDGIERSEELLVIVARTNQGKSWVLAKICSHIWGLGFNVGYFSPEMSDTKIGFRFDTLTKHYSNRALLSGGEDVNEDDYQDYIKGLKTNTNKFIVATPRDFANEVTVTKLKNWIRKFKLDIIAIDGITYLTDERGKRNDNKTTSLTDICEDLMSLSIELSIPVLIVVQANRTGVMGEESDGTPELESIRDSDGISHNATKVISLQQKKDNVLEMGIKKNRNGLRGGKLKYSWDANTGTFTFIPSHDDVEPQERTRKKVDKQGEQFKSRQDVF